MVQPTLLRLCSSIQAVPSINLSFTSKCQESNPRHLTKMLKCYLCTVTPQTRKTFMKIMRPRSLISTWTQRPRVWFLPFLKTFLVILIMLQRFIDGTAYNNVQMLDNVLASPRNLALSSDKLLVLTKKKPFDWNPTFDGIENDFLQNKNVTDWKRDWQGWKKKNISIAAILSNCESLRRKFFTNFFSSILISNVTED